MKFLLNFEKAERFQKWELRESQTYNFEIKLCFYENVEIVWNEKWKTDCFMVSILYILLVSDYKSTLIKFETYGRTTTAWPVLLLKNVYGLISLSYFINISPYVPSKCRTLYPIWRPVTPFLTICLPCHHLVKWIFFIAPDLRLTYRYQVQIAVKTLAYSTLSLSGADSYLPYDTPSFW